MEFKTNRFRIQGTQLNVVEYTELKPIVLECVELKTNRLEYMKLTF